MRVLHPVRAHEALLDAGALIRPDGTTETWQVHALPAGRVAVRVEADGPALWHLVLDADGRPERLQARLRDNGRTVEATFTFFDDEVLIWRRGAEPGSQSIALPPGTRLLWPPIAGRDRCLTGLGAGVAPLTTDADPVSDNILDAVGPDAAMFLLVHLSAADQGGLSARLAQLTVLPGPDGLGLHSPDLPDMALSIDTEGRLTGWAENGAAVVRRSAPGGPST